MALNLYRRHRRKCKAGHPHQHLSSEFDERKRGWKRCECPIVVSGTLQKRFKRHSTNLWEWAAARSIAEQFEAAGSWDGMVPVVAAPAEATESAPKSRTTIEDTVKIFLTELQESIAPGTHKKYRLLLR